jgi:putative ABC transport system permease protein
MGIIIGSLEQGLIYAIMALGVFISFKILSFPDLSVDGSFPMGAAISALLITSGVNPLLSLLFAFSGGALAGLFTALLNTKGKIDGLLAGILTMTALYSINLKIMGTANLSIYRHRTIFTPLRELRANLLANYGETKFILTLNQWLFVIVLALALYAIKKSLDWFLRTDFGLAICATGDNPKMIRSFGVNTNLSTVVGLMLANGLVGLAGGMLAQYQGYADVQMGIGMIVIGLASVIIGYVIFGSKSIKRATFAVLIGAIIYRFVIALAIYLPFIGPTDMKLITAIIVIIALVFPNISKNFKQRLGINKNSKNEITTDLGEVD